MTTGETVTTWADGFGVWHARVDFPWPGYGPVYLGRGSERIRRKARRAIRRELEAPRDPAEDDYIWRETCDVHDTIFADHEPVTP